MSGWPRGRFRPTPECHNTAQFLNRVGSYRTKLVLSGSETRCIDDFGLHYLAWLVGVPTLLASLALPRLQPLPVQVQVAALMNPVRPADRHHLVARRPLAV